MKQFKLALAGLAAVAILAAAFLLFSNRPAVDAVENAEHKSPAPARTAKSPSHIRDKAASEAIRESDPPVATGNDAEERAAEDSEGDSEGEVDEDERRVEAFDAATDRWMDPEKTKSPTMDDIAAFTAQFKSLPKERRDECLHRALNLLPDENVMLLVGILMDKTIDKELVELVYNDVLNRSEDVKKPILRQIFEDKTHPCWADTAWILDVTGQLPKKE